MQYSWENLQAKGKVWWAHLQMVPGSYKVCLPVAAACPPPGGPASSLTAGPTFPGPPKSLRRIVVKGEFRPMFIMEPLPYYTFTPPSLIHLYTPLPPSYTFYNTGCNVGCVRFQEGGGVLNMIWSRFNILWN